MPLDHPFVQLSTMVFALIYCLVALIFFVLALLMRWVSSNPGSRAFGLRIRETLHDADIWRRVHLRIRLPLAAGGALCVLAAVLIYIFPATSVGGLAYAHGLVMLGIALLVWTWIKQIARAAYTDYSA